MIDRIGGSGGSGSSNEAEIKNRIESVDSYSELLDVLYNLRDENVEMPENWNIRNKQEDQTWTEYCIFVVNEIQIGSETESRYNSLDERFTSLPDPIEAKARNLH